MPWCPSLVAHAWVDLASVSSEYISRSNSWMCANFCNYRQCALNTELTVCRSIIQFLYPTQFAALDTASHSLTHTQRSVIITHQNVNCFGIWAYYAMYEADIVSYPPNFFSLIWIVIVYSVAYVLLCLDTEISRADIDFGRRMTYRR